TVFNLPAGSLRQSGWLCGRAGHRHIDSAPVRLPAWISRARAVRWHRQLAEVLVFDLILAGIGSGIAPLPKCLNEFVALFVVLQEFANCSHSRCDDPDDVMLEPNFEQRRFPVHRVWCDSTPPSTNDSKPLDASHRFLLTNPRVGNGIQNVGQEVDRYIGEA